MRPALAALAWPESRLGEALHGVVRAGAVGPPGVELPNPPALDPEQRARWLDVAAAKLGFEADPVSARHADADRIGERVAPGILSLPGEEARFLAVIAAARGAVIVAAPDGGRARVSSADLREALCEAREGPARIEAERILDESGIRGARRGRARDAMVRARVRHAPLAPAWTLRVPPSAPLRRQAHGAGLPGRLAALVLAHAFQHVLWLASWWIVGTAAIQGHLDRAWLIAWVLTLATLVPTRLLVTWLQGSLAVRAGALLKRRLLFGALRLEPEEIRNEGVGRLLGRVVESEAVEQLALGGGLLALVSIVELIAAAIVLAAGAGGWLQATCLVAWVAVIAAWTNRYLRARRAWTHERLAMTHDLVEKMVGYRTRLAQEDPARRHAGEDEALERYESLGRAMDGAAARLVALSARGWLVVGMLGLAPAFVTGAPATSLAIAVGGVLLGAAALDRLASGWAQLAGAAISWANAAPLFRAGGRPERTGTLEAAALAPGESRAPASPLLEAHDLVFRYRERGAPAVSGLSVAIGPRERCLVEGPSGGGKSTCASLLAGLRRPESGVLLLEGLDAPTLGPDGWRRRVAAAPQFHDNHVLAETFAFNVLMGRRWPPRAEDMAEAEAVCRELGLGALLERMPAGILQRVGETGWQLSHGERSRLFIARALLQDPQLLVLDESFAALDPETLGTALRCVLARGRAILVLAHP